MVDNNNGMEFAPEEQKVVADLGDAPEAHGETTGPDIVMTSEEPVDFKADEDEEADEQDNLLELEIEAEDGALKGASFRSNNHLASPKHQPQLVSEISDGINSGLAVDNEQRMSAMSNEQMNVVMKEEQENFGYEDIDKGSNKSFSQDGGEESKVPMNLNMDQLIQNPGRPSQGPDETTPQKMSERNAKPNIFANKVRKNTRSAEKSAEKQPSSNDEQNMDFRNISSAGEEDEEDDDDDDDQDDKSGDQPFNIKEELVFEKICINMMNQQNWNGLAIVSKKHLQKNHTSSWKAFFYYGVAMYKQGEYVLAIAAFEKAERINEDDAQLQYNQGLAYFKIGNYQHTVEHLKKCILLDNKHPYAYNNLAFLFNIHMIYKETLNICRQAKEFNRVAHNTHMHWAFAEFKEGNIVKAIKKIRKGVQKQPLNAECWIVWGLILRSAGKYKSARHKFEKAIKLNPKNETAKLELNLVNNLMHFDDLLPTDAQLKLSQEAYAQALGLGDNRQSQNAGAARSFCQIF